MFDLDRVEPRQGRASSAITPGHWFHGVNIYGKARRYKFSPGAVPTLNAAVYGLESGGYNRVQTYLKVHGKWQLGAVSIVHLQWKGGCL